MSEFEGKATEELKDSLQKLERIALISSIEFTKDRIASLKILKESVALEVEKNKKLIERDKLKIEHLEIEIEQERQQLSAIKATASNILYNEERR